MPKFSIGYAHNRPYLPDGTFTFRIVDYERKGEAPQDYFKFRFKVMDHPEHKGKFYAENFGNIERSIWKMEKLLLAVGFEGNDYNTDDDKFLRKTLVGKILKMKIITRKTQRGDRQCIAYNGFYTADGGAVLTTASDSGAEDLNEFLNEEDIKKDQEKFAKEQTKEPKDDCPL